MRLNLLVSAVLLVSLVVVTPASAVGAGVWVVDLAAVEPGSTNVATGAGGVRLGAEDNRAASAGTAGRTGFAMYSHRFGVPVNGFSAQVRDVVPAGAEVAIDVRGRSAGQWTEWTEIVPGAPAVLPVAVSDVQVRVLVAAEGATPVVEGVVVRGERLPDGPARSGDGMGFSYPVFATREGLVGGTTANGHRITSRDHFVALPSRRGLAARGGGEYSVRVCAANGRCAWAPVWDVGPWNTRDDYWALPGVRQEWWDLPQGKPASQAAYQDGYNGGRDQFGRKVANPAGIDLADGTFWDGLKLRNNAWVTVTYLWAGSYPAGYVRTPGDTLNVRSGPTSQAPVVGIAGNAAQVRVECVAAGETVAGSQGTTSAWYRVSAGMFVSAAYVSGGGTAPAC